MIRPSLTPRPDSCCISADVLTPPERYAWLLQTSCRNGMALPKTLVYRASGKTWGDEPELREILESLRSKP